MYVDVLSAAFQALESGLTGESLVDHVVDCRVQMLMALGGAKPSAYDLLALEIAYDVSLIHLCDDLGVPATVADFENPLTERTRIEQDLVQTRGLDLSALSRSRRRN